MSSIKVNPRQVINLNKDESPLAKYCRRLAPIATQIKPKLANDHKKSRYDKSLRLYLEEASALSEHPATALTNVPAYL
jgi:hypothetical protein